MRNNLQANDDNEIEGETPDDVQLDSRRRTLLSFPPEQQRAFFEKERVINHCIRERLAHKGRIPSATKQAAVAQLGISTRQLELDIHSYQAFLEKYPHRPSVEGVIPQTVGRSAHPSLTADQQAIAVFAYLSPSWIAVIRHQSARLAHNVVPTVEMVYDFLCYVYDVSFSIHTLRRFLKKHGRDNSALHDYARSSSEEFLAKYVLSRSNDVIAPNIRWQSDARPLPIYILHDGVMCTVTFLTIIDDHSRAVLAWMILPRKIRDDDGDIRKIDFTAHHVRLLLVKAFLNTNTRPLIVYTDNGKQYEALKDKIGYLTSSHEPPIETIFSQRGAPQGRGKVEAYLKTKDAGLNGGAGFVRNEKQWRHTYSQLKKHPEALDSLEDIRAVIVEAIAKWNNQSTKGVPRSRWEQWEAGRATSLLAPEQYRYLVFGIASFWGKKAVTNDGIYHQGQHFIPVDPAGYERMKRAIRPDHTVPFALIEDDEYPKAQTTFVDDYWEELVPSNYSPLSVEEHVQAKEVVIRSTKAELEAGLKRLYEIISARVGLERPAFIRGSNTIATKEQVDEVQKKQKEEKKRTTPKSSSKKMLPSPSTNETSMDAIEPTRTDADDDDSDLIASWSDIVRSRK